MPDNTAPESTDTRAARPAWAPAALLLALSVLWFVTVMWESHQLITGHVGQPSVAMSSAATALPVLVAASLLTGAAAGLLAASIAMGGRPVGAIGRRLVAGAVGGAVCGLAAAGVILVAYGANGSVAVLAATVGAAAVLGGLTTALPRRVLAVAIAATVAVFLVSVIVNAFQGPLTAALGAGETLASRATAAVRLAYLQSALCGVVAGVVAFVGLRRAAAGFPWPAYLVAGAGPGLALLLAEMVTRIGGASLLDFVRGLSAGDEMIMAYGDAARLRNAMIVGFTGGILAMILYGRTLRPAADEPPTDEAGADDAGADDAGADDAGAARD